MKKKIKMSKEVLFAIYDSIGALTPEQGGMLGTSNGVEVDNYIFDDEAEVGFATYTPNIEFLQKELNDWRENSVELIGFVHSHPTGFIFPSSADVEYAKRIINEIDSDYLFLPIINTVPETGLFEIYPYIVTLKKGKAKYHKVKLLVDGVKFTGGNPYDVFGEVKLNDTTFDRISNVIDIGEMNNSLIVGIGCGGAREFYIDMARMGVGNFLLIDGDIVSKSNISSQKVYACEIGMPKCEATKERILQINEEANVVAVNKMLDDEISDEMLEQLIASFNCTNIIICGFTDSFIAQARASRIALKYGFPYLAGQHYEQGQMCEVVYWYPNLSPKCPRCLLNTRYEYYLEYGYKNKVTSKGSPIFNTVRLHALCEKIALGILMYKSNPNSVFSAFLMHPEKQFIVIRQQMFLDNMGGLECFFNQGGNILFDEPVWLSFDDLNEDFDCKDCNDYIYNHSNIDTSCIKKNTDVLILISLKIK